MTRDKRYLHFDISAAQQMKKGQNCCGDVYCYIRDEVGTTVILCDGIGSGVRAHISAKMCMSRLRGLLEKGASVHGAFENVISTMEKWRQPDKPYTAFLVGRILNDGHATVLNYDGAGPVLVNSQYAMELNEKPVILNGVVAKQSNCYLRPGDGLLFFSDGVSQAGIGRDHKLGWGSKGVAKYVQELGGRNLDIPGEVCRRVYELSGEENQDDVTAILAGCRYGRAISIMTGPPLSKRDDAKVVKSFLERDGAKVVCGATTSQIVSRESGCELEMEDNWQSMVAPPRYYMEGLDLVTEGAVTLNQLCNIIDLDPDDFEQGSSVTDLYELLMGADRIHMMMGMGKNPANSNIVFNQQGILNRDIIVPILAEKLRQKGKLVLIERF